MIEGRRKVISNVTRDPVYSVSTMGWFGTTSSFETSTCKSALIKP
jgi:hypothetical protein